MTKQYSVLSRNGLLRSVYIDEPVDMDRLAMTNLKGLVVDLKRMQPHRWEAHTTQARPQSAADAGSGSLAAARRFCVVGLAVR